MLLRSALADRRVATGQEILHSPSYGGIVLGMRENVEAFLPYGAEYVISHLLR